MLQPTQKVITDRMKDSKKILSHEILPVLHTL